MTRVRTGEKALLISVSAVLILALYYVSIGSASNILNLLGVLALGVTSFLIFKTRGGWVFLLYAFGLTFALSSGALIELTGAYLIEIQETAYLTGSAARNAFLATFFLITTFFSYKLFLRIIPSRLPVIKTAEPIATRALLAVAFATPIYIATILITHGSPLFMGMDRFNYFTYIAPPGYRWFHGNIPLLGFVVALSAYKGVIRHSTSLVWLTLTVAIYIMAGEKFSGLFLLGFFFFLPFFLISNPIIKVKHLALGAMVVLAMAIMVIINYMMIYGSAEILVPRLALQGQMNYALDLLADSIQTTHSIAKHLTGIGAPENDTGLVHLMHLVAPAATVDRMVEHGATFTTPFPANINYFFGFYLAPFAILSLSITTGATSALLSKSTMASNMILSIVSAKLFLLTYVTITMGKINLLFEAKTALMISLIILYLSTLLTRQTATHLNP